MFTNKKIAIIFLTVIMVVLVSSIFAANITHFAPEYGVTTANVNLRNRPTSDYSSFVRTLPTNTKIKIVGTIDDYYIVQLETNEVGIISKAYAKITGERINSDIYTDYEPFYGTIKNENTIVRGGPSTTFKVYARLPQGAEVYVIGAINDFLLVITSDNTVGMIRQDLISKNNQSEVPTPQTIQPPQVSDENANVNYILTRINSIRNENGLPPLSIDKLLQSTAESKAADMVKNNYFSHISPTYGTPFEMMEKAGINFKTAGENIAGNTSIDDAIASWLESEEHSENILSNSYNYIGIGIEESPLYGYVIVLMFIGK